MVKFFKHYITISVLSTVFEILYYVVLKKELTFLTSIVHVMVISILYIFIIRLYIRVKSKVNS